jgi:hypothetical protein
MYSYGYIKAKLTLTNLAPFITKALLRMIIPFYIQIYIYTHCTHIYGSRHQIAYFKATDGLQPTYREALSHQYSVASIATLRVPNYLYSPGLCCSFCNVGRFCCDLEACNLVTATIALKMYFSQKSQQYYLVLITATEIELHFNYYILA